MQLHLRKLLLSDAHLSSAICVNEDQQAFSGGHAWQISEHLRSSPYPEAVNPFMVVHRENAVGFFVLRQKRQHSLAGHRPM
ncbi:hypothetical protein IG197_31465 (plasmid) [Aminobacter sp. SR38]|jgi:hypothetical protein|uniref:hypothetical protein n=1 Tax=Aminobacter sp. SR38 TaxID=2774562 RepID=UPI00177C7813|nr:hypothetical protein [Aminobacter sp. SR38]QOF75038.1 hypothetical protein IG197_31465 [Aminobacter sp. SR38]